MTLSSCTRRLAVLPALALLTAAAAAGVSTSAASAAPKSPKGPKGPPPVELQLLALNDFHGQLEPPTGSGSRLPGFAQTGDVDVFGGAEHLATQVRELEQDSKKKNTLTVAAGDLIGASPLLSAAFHDEPAIESLNRIGLDYASVGNHEFDEGAAELLRIQNGGCHPVDGCQTGHTYAGADFPYLSANVVVEKTGETLLPPYVVKKVKGVKVGFIGMTLEGTPDIVSAEGIAGLRFLDEAATANRYATELRKQGVESIVVLLHEGGVQRPATSPANGCVGINGPIVDIVNAMDASIDAVLTAHTHSAYNCEINDKLVTSGASFGRLVTDVRLKISSSSKDVVSATANNVVVTREEQYRDAELQSLVDYYGGLSNTVAGRQVGTISASILRAARANGESPLGDVIADSQLVATAGQGAVAAFMNPGGIRADLSYAPAVPAKPGDGPGIVTYGDAFTVQPFNNLLTTITLTGAELKAVLEQQYAVGRVLQPAGITYSVSSSAPVGSKVSNIVLGGAPLVATTSYRITVNNFLAGGGDGFTTLLAGKAPVNSGLDIDAFTAYLSSNPNLAPPAASRITLLP